MQIKERLNVHCRWLIRRDMPELNAIEATLPEPLLEADLLDALRNRNVIGMVAEIGDRVLGYMVYEMHKAKLEIFRLAVHPDYRRRGVGSQMVAKMVSKLSSHRRQRLGAMVPETSLDMLLLLKANGMLATRVHRNYFGGGVDAIRMVIRLKETQ